MKIVIDGRMLFWTGVGRYTRVLLDELARQDRINDYVVLTRPADRRLWEPTTKNFRRLEVDINPYSLGEQLRLPGVIARLRPDVVHFVSGNAPMLYGGRRVVTVHDLTLLDFDTSRGTGLKRLVRRLKRWPFWLVLAVNVRRAVRIITPTEYVKGELMRRFGVTERRVTVTLLAADANLARPESIERLGIGGDFLLNVGNVYPYKNLGLAVRALKLLEADYPDLKLVSTSKPDYFRERLEKLAEELGVRDRVIFTGFVTEGELVTLYRQAKMYVYPSLTEGFGLQMLESMALGLPVVASRASCLPEIGGEAAEYFDPAEVEDLGRAISSLLKYKRKRNELRRAGLERARLFSWQRTATQTLAVYEQAAERDAARRV